jgi:hypothetical protein
MQHQRVGGLTRREANWGRKRKAWQPPPVPQSRLSYFNWLEMLLNVELKLVPSVFTATMIATEIPAAMRPYSMAVAPTSSFRKRRRSFFIRGS